MTSVPNRASRTAEYEVEEDDSFYPQKMPSTARRYITTQGQRVIQQGNRRIVIHPEPPPRHLHWSFLIGLGMLATLFLWVVLSQAAGWWGNYQLNQKYGMPRTYQTDQVVGHDDSTTHPSHFTFENLNGHIVIIELPGGNISHAKIYAGPSIFSGSPASAPVTADFEDVNGDGKIDMVVIVGDQRVVYVNDGTQFKPQQ